MESIFNISFPGGKKVEAHFKNFTIHSDQPVEEEGNDASPTPFEYFLASIGMCAGFYVLSFCQSRFIPTDHISITQTVNRHQTTHLVEKIILEISLPQDFPMKYKSAVVNAAQTCSVKKFLDAPPEIQINAVAQEKTESAPR